MKLGCTLEQFQNGKFKMLGASMAPQNQSEFAPGQETAGFNGEWLGFVSGRQLALPFPHCVVLGRPSALWFIWWRPNSKHLNQKENFKAHVTKKFKGRICLMSLFYFLLLSSSPSPSHSHHCFSLYYLHLPGTPFKKLGRLSRDNLPSQTHRLKGDCPCWSHIPTLVPGKLGRWLETHQDNMERRVTIHKSKGCTEDKTVDSCPLMEPPSLHLQNGLEIYLVKLVVSVMDHKWEELCTY